MENASKALIIAGAILLSILIIALGIFVFQQAKGTVNTTQLDATEKETFNAPIAQYEGRQNGTATKALVSHLISNAGINKGATDRLPQVYYDKGSDGPVITNFNIEATSGNSNIARLSDLRSKLISSHQYDIEVTYDGTTGLINRVNISY